MGFSETGNRPDIQTNKSEAELKSELSAINQERCDHCTALENQWPNIPAKALQYLAYNCPAPELMSPVLSELQTIVAADPLALSEPSIIPFVIDDCIMGAKANANDEIEVFKKETAESLDTTADVISEINNETAELNGRAKLNAAIAYLNNPDIPQTVREELSARLSHIGNTLDEMSAVFTDETSQAEFQLIVSTASFDLGAPNLTTALAPILDKVESSDTFTDDQKLRLRQIVAGSDAQDILRETVTDENGVTRPRYSQKYQREIRTGVSGYVEGHGRHMIEARAGDHIVTKDVSGWSSEQVGSLIETMHMWNTLEGFGVTGFVENIYKIDFSILGDGNAFDPIQVRQMQQVLTHLVGGLEGGDGDIAELSEKKTLLHNQARLISQTQAAFGWENDQSGTSKVLRRLGMQDEKGNPNYDIIGAFGDYTQEQFGSGAVDQFGLVAYLSRLYPEFVKPVSEQERQTARLDMSMN